ncbi:hypothetical protein DFH08DRAFT_706003, partial [Mycena albidolilacea]
LLHIPDNIVNTGPMWCYWNYITERFVDFMVRSSKSRKKYASLSRRMRDVTQNNAIKVRNDLHRELNLSDHGEELRHGHRFPECELLLCF